MEIKAFRVAAYLLIGHYLIVVALTLVKKGDVDYMNLVFVSALLYGAVRALFSPRNRGWLAVVAYCIVVIGRHAITLTLNFSNPTVPVGIKVAGAVMVVGIDLLAIAALVLVFKPVNFAAFSSSNTGAIEVQDAASPRLPKATR